jgi:signal transduction histidine kinase
MSRRTWPIALAVLALLVLGSYLAYTQLLVREIKTQAEVSSRIFAQVQRGLLAETEAERLTALLEIQRMLDALDVPMVAFNSEDEPYAATRSLPFPPDLGSPEGIARLREWAERREERQPGSRAAVEGQGAVVFGEPRLIGWLRWVPWLQVLGGGMLVVVAAAIIRADLRAERERLWAAMARELAHQMGTPLSSLAGWIEVLSLPEEERAGMASLQHIAEVAGTDLERLERVSRRFELIGKPPALEMVSLREVIEELAAYFSPRLPRLGHNIRLRARLGPGIDGIHANRVLLVWALENVVKNAVDALGGRGGRILVLAHGEPSQRRVHVHITDDGPGIAPHVRDRIFEPGVTTKAGGWGVGLSLTRRIIEDLHGGRVTVRNRRRRGTVFDVVLPVAGARRRRFSLT